MAAWRYGLLRNEMLEGDRSSAAYGYVWYQSTTTEVLTGDDTRQNFLRALDVLGRDGWEMVGHHEDGSLLKRRVEDAQ